ncbi:MAG TPA: YIP1 family protein [Bacteroidota bacterium]|nr:YIP1 family protein [Bacteroidota bacterium]
MDETPTTQAAPVESNEMSFSDKLMNVFTAPGELFDYVAKSEKQTGNWSVPLIISMIVSVIFVLVAFSQAPVQDQMKDQQEKAIQKRVVEGKMTQEQADLAMSKNPAQPGSPLFMIFGSIGAVFMAAVALFGFALVFWLVGKWVFKSAATYQKVLEVVGLSLYVSIVATVITLLLVVAMGSLYATPSLALAISHFDPTDKVDKLLSAINLGTLWFLAVIGIGLGKIFATTSAKALAAVGTLWVIWSAVSVLWNFGM